MNKESVIKNNNILQKKTIKTKTKIKILVVDDEKDFSDLIKVVLKKHDYEVFLAYNGEEALQRVSEIKPDLLILDLNMPKMDGYEVCKRIRLTYSYKDIAVLMLTVRTLEQDYIEGFSCGSDDYMVKPFEPKELLARIKNLLIRVGKIEKQ
ncbi:MAG: response regulator transcription factor [Elusimicrobiota bacterium]|jgi:two-component system response regulator VicR|nr:response regulator transcription factor [Elusimicrobiota bacterium]